MYNYVKGLHSYEQDLEEGDLGERLWKYPIYVLKNVPTKRINAPWQTDSEIVRNYLAEFKQKQNYPPIVLTAGLTVIDGMHRYEALVAAGVDKILAYVGKK
jgi:hypothetical protein